MQNIIFWFRNDLRLHDNETFLEASKAGNVVPVYVFDTRYFEKNFLGFKRTGAFRTKFLLEAVEDLRKNLREQGSDLIVRIGYADEIIAQIAKDLDATAVYASKEVTQDETTIEALLSKQIKPLNIDIDLIWTATLYHARDLPFQINFLPKGFPNFRKKIEQSTKVRKTFDVPTELAKTEGIEPGRIPTFQELGFESEPVLDARAVLDFKGGETEGLKRLHEYIWQKDLLKNYKETHNGLIGADYSSKLSPWLSLGCISARQVYEAVRKYEAEVVANESTDCLISELIWRDYFYFIALKSGTRMFKASGIKNDLMKQWKRHKPTFETWVKGETGVPFIDANMHEIQKTGFMSNLGRQNVANYLAKDLGIDWTWGAAYFESALIDYDVCLNWINWNYVAGVGHDPQEGRMFDAEQQGTMNDPEEEYIKLWLGENIHS
jgi:deoxyribodipyrimidine photo-lyase